MITYGIYRRSRIGAHAESARVPRSGFTLIEIVVVIALISMIVAIAFPQLIPVIAFSKHEGSARHLANFGRSAMAQSILMHERLTIRIDLDQQEYWAVRWPEPEEDGDELFEDRLFGSAGEKTKDRDRDKGRSKNKNKSSGSFFSAKDTPRGSIKTSESNGEPTDPDEEALEMRARFDQLSRLAVQAQARNVSGGILDEIGPLFDHDFTLDSDADKKEKEEEVMEPLLLRTKLPPDVMIEKVFIGPEEHASGLVEIEITPLGLLLPVAFYVKDASGDYFTVTWDAITCGAHLQAGKASLL